MKKFVIMATLFSSLASASEGNFSQEIVNLYNAGKISEGEYSLLKEMSRQDVKRAKVQSQEEVLNNQRAQIEQLRRENKISDAEYSILLEMHTNLIKALNQ